MKLTTHKCFEHSDFDALVCEVYGRIYSLQQQEGCQSRGTRWVSVPDTPEDYERESIPEVINGEEMGVSFKAWLARDPKLPCGEGQYDWETSLFWERNFYPHLSMVLNDLHKRDLIDAGEYVILIDW